MGTDPPKPKQFLPQSRFVLHKYIFWISAFCFFILFLNSGGRDTKIIKIGVHGSRGVGSQIIMNLLLQGNNKVKLVAINEPSISAEDMAALFNYLRPGGQHVFEAKNENTLQFGQNSVRVLAIRYPAEIPWADMGVEYVIESTGSFTVKDKAAAHLRGGAKKVIITDVSKDVPMFVFGVNEKDYKPDQDDIVSSASLITHQLAPILEVLHESFGIFWGDMKILDSAIATRHIDGPSTTDYVDRRPAFFNPIPIFTSGAKAAGKFLQALHGSFGIGGGLMPTLNTLSSIIDAIHALETFLETIDDNLGIDDGPIIQLRKFLRAPAAVNTTAGPSGASSSGIFPADVEAVEKVLAYLYGKLTGTVSHGPTRDRSIVLLTVSLELEATLEHIKAAIKEESEGKFKGILGYTEDDHSTKDDHSRDFVGDRRSSIFNAKPTTCSALDNNHFKFIFDCDNQWGYSWRVIDLILHMDSVQAQS